MSQCIEHAEKIAVLETSLKSAHHSIRTIEENQKILYEMNTNIRLLAEQNKTQQEEMKGIKTDVKELNNKVDRLEDKPLVDTTNNYNKIKWLIISTSLGGIMGYFINQIL